MCDSCRTNGRKRRDRAHPYFFSFQTIWLLFLILKDNRNIRTLIDKINIILTCCETCTRYVFLYIDTPKKKTTVLANATVSLHYRYTTNVLFSIDEWGP